MQMSLYLMLEVTVQKCVSFVFGISYSSSILFQDLLTFRTRSWRSKIGLGNGPDVINNIRYILNIARRKDFRKNPGFPYPPFTRVVSTRVEGIWFSTWKFKRIIFSNFFSLFQINFEPKWLSVIEKKEAYIKRFVQNALDYEMLYL